MKELVCHIQAEYAGKPVTTITLEMPTELLEQINRTAALEDTDAASIINCPSRTLCEQGFSTYTSLPAWQAQIVINECQ